MKDNPRLFALIILLAIILISVFSCDTKQQKLAKKTEVVYYDSCQYLYFEESRGNYTAISITHKGNCKNHDKN